MSSILSLFIGCVIGWFLPDLYRQLAARLWSSRNTESVVASLTNPILVELRRAEWNAMEAGVLRCTDADDARLRILYWAPLVFADIATQTDVSFFIVRHRNRIYDAERAMDEKETVIVN